MTKQNSRRPFRFIYSLVLCVAVLSLIMITQTVLAWNFTVPALQVRPNNGSFEFPLALFRDGKALHFEYRHTPSQVVRFFLVQSSDGVLRAAFDACEVCYRAKKGYAQEGNNMVCIHCGLKFKTDKINQARGGCNPAPLNLTVQGEKVLISEQEVLSGLRYFQ